LPGYHTHDYAEIFWLNGGSCDHYVNGRMQQLKTGSVVLMRASDAHELRPVRGRSFRFTNLAFAADCFASLKQRYRTEVEWLYERTRLPLQRMTRQGELNELNEAGRELARAPHTVFALERTIMNIWQLFFPRQPFLTETAPYWLRDALLEVEEPDVFSKGVEGFVRAAGRSHAHVTRACRQHIGKTPMELIHEMRLRHAAHLLRMSSLSVLEISQNCGYENPAQFHRMFKSRFGTTPRKYRIQ